MVLVGVMDGVIDGVCVLEAVREDVILTVGVFDMVGVC